MSDLPNPGLAVFDLCDTLYAENTTHGFIRWLHARNGRRRRAWLIRLLDCRYLPVFWFLAALHRFPGVDLARRIAVLTLHGLSRSELESAASGYATSRLPGVGVPATQERLARHRDAGDRVVIVSSSLDIVVAAVARRLGAEAIGSTLGFRDGRCTGRIDRDLTGRKAPLVAALAGEGPDRPVIHVYTDNLTDRPLVAAADRPTVVIPAGSSRARWGEIDAAFIEL